MPDINYLAILVSGVATMVLGFIWYGPLFGKRWSTLMGYNISDPQKMAQMQKAATPAYIASFITSLIQAAVLAGFLAIIGPSSATIIFGTAFCLWLGFIATIQLTQIMFSQKPKALLPIDAGYWLAVMLVMAAIIGYWPF